MGLFDNVKDSVKQAQSRAADKREVRGNLLASVAVNYIGGYGDCGTAIGVLTCYENQFEFKVPMMDRHSFTIPTADISDLAIEGKDQVSSRVTVTRLLAVGIFAFALKKKKEDKDAYVTLTLADGQEVVFQIDKKSPAEMKKQLVKVTSYLGASRQAAASPKPDAGDPYQRLEKIAQLKDAGVLTETEYEAKKAELLELL